MWAAASRALPAARGQASLAALLPSLHGRAPLSDQRSFRRTQVCFRGCESGRGPCGLDSHGLTEGHFQGRMWRLDWLLKTTGLKHTRGLRAGEDLDLDMQQAPLTDGGTGTRRPGEQRGPEPALPYSQSLAECP